MNLKSQRVQLVCLFLIITQNSLYFTGAFWMVYLSSWLKFTNHSLSVRSIYWNFFFQDVGIILGNSILVYFFHFIGLKKTLQFGAFLSSLVAILLFLIRHIYASYFVNLMVGVCNQFFVLTVIQLITVKFPLQMTEFVGKVFSGTSFAILCWGFLLTWFINPQNLKQSKCVLIDGVKECFFDSSVLQNFPHYMIFFAIVTLIISLCLAQLIDDPTEKHSVVNIYFAKRKILKKVGQIKEDQMMQKFEEYRVQMNKLDNLLEVKKSFDLRLLTLNHSKSFQTFGNYSVVNPSLNFGNRFDPGFKSVNLNKNLLKKRRDSKEYALSNYQRVLFQLKQCLPNRESIDLEKSHKMSKNQQKLDFLEIELKKNSTIINSKNNSFVEKEESLIESDFEIVDQEKQKEPNLKTSEEFDKLEVLENKNIRQEAQEVAKSAKFLLFFFIAVLRNATSMYTASQLKFIGIVLFDNDFLITLITMATLIFNFFARLNMGRIVDKIGFINSYYLQFSVSILTDIVCIILFNFPSKTLLWIFVSIQRMSIGVAYTLNYVSCYEIFGKDKAVFLMKYYDSQIVFGIFIAAIMNSWLTNGIDLKPMYKGFVALDLFGILLTFLFKKSYLKKHSTVF